MVATGCAKAIDGRPVAAGPPGAFDDSQCTRVDVPMETIPPAAGAPDDAEPTLRTARPEGWKRMTQLDSAMIRFAMGNAALGVGDFAASAVVTMESQPGDVARDHLRRRQAGFDFGTGRDGRGFHRRHPVRTACPDRALHHAAPEWRVASWGDRSGRRHAQQRQDLRRLDNDPVAPARRSQVPAGCRRRHDWVPGACAGFRASLARPHTLLISYSRFRCEQVAAASRSRQS
jgi:hypothetical protein